MSSSEYDETRFVHVVAEREHPGDKHPHHRVRCDHCGYVPRKARNPKRQHPRTFWRRWKTAEKHRAIHEASHGEMPVVVLS